MASESSSTPSSLVFIGLGSNIEDPLQQLKRAINTLKDDDRFSIQAISPLYSSKPVGPQDQPDFVNAVLSAQWQGAAETLLDRLQEIEQLHERKRLRHWGPRTLDLDILLFGTQQISSPRLEIPHKELHKRAFVLKPLADIAPDLTLPSGNSVTELLKQLPDEDLASLTPITTQSH